MTASGAGKAKGAGGCRLELHGDLSKAVVRHGAAASCTTYEDGDLLWWHHGSATSTSSGSNGKREDEVRTWRKHNTNK